MDTLLFLHVFCVSTFRTHASHFAGIGPIVRQRGAPHLTNMLLAIEASNRGVALEQTQTPVRSTLHRSNISYQLERKLIFPIAFAWMGYVSSSKGSCPYRYFRGEINPSSKLQLAPVVIRAENPTNPGPKWSRFVIFQVHPGQKSHSNKHLSRVQKPWLTLYRLVA